MAGKRILRLLRGLGGGAGQVVELAALVQSLGGIDSSNLQAVAGALTQRERSQTETAAREQVLEALVALARDSNTPPQVRLDAAEAVLDATE